MIAVLCQTCGTRNPDEREYCLRCSSKLLVLSGPPEGEEEELLLGEEMAVEAQEAFEEHLLERITTLEDTVRRLAQAAGGLAERLNRLEHEQAVSQTGVEVLGDLLQTHGVLSRTELADGWERSVGRELLSRDLARRFVTRSRRILSLAAHAGHASERFRRQLRELESTLAAGETEAAREELAELVELAPDNDELWSFAGEVSFELGDLQAARIAFERVLELRGTHFETLIYLGTVLSDLAEWDQAERILRTALELEPDAFLARFTLGALEVLRGNHEESLPLLESALELEEAPQVHYLLGVSHLQLRRPGRAIAALERAVELAPDFEDALYHLGLAYLRRGWSRRARETFQQVLHLDPHRLQYQETVRLLSLQTPTDLPPEAASLVARAESALERGNPDTALDLFAIAADIAPEQLGLRATAALLAAALGRDRDAVSHAHILLRRNLPGAPYRAAAVAALLEALRHAGRPQTARRFARALYRQDSDPLSRGLAAYELALVESELGSDLEDARELAREALEITPKELRHYPLSALGEIALKRGRFREAVQYLEQATAAAPRPALLQQLALARLAAGDPDGAEAALQSAHSGATGGLEEELLGHVRRLGSLLGSVRRHQPERDGSHGG